MEREEELAYVGPGSHEVAKTFGSDVHHKMHFGRPYVFKPSQNPAPGSYETSSNIIRPKMSVSRFNQSEKGDRLGKSSFLNSDNKNNPTGANY